MRLAEENIIMLGVNALILKKDYLKKAVPYVAKHGEIYANKGNLSAEEYEIIQNSKLYEEAYERVNFICNILEFDLDEKLRLETVWKAIRRWLNMTGWERELSKEILDRIWRFIESGSASGERKL